MKKQKKPKALLRRRYRFAQLFLVTVLLLCSYIGYGQEKKFDLKLNNVTLEQAFDEIEKKTDFRFMYSQQAVDVKQRVTVDLTQKTISELVAAVLAGKNINYQIAGQQIVLSPRQAAQQTTQQGATTEQKVQAGITTQNTNAGTANGTPQQKGMLGVRGKVTDAETGEAMPFVTVVIRNMNGTVVGTSTTNDNGIFQMGYPNASDVLSASFMGYETQEIKLNGRAQVDVALKPDVQVLDEVVVTGYQTISKDRATGAYAIVNNQTLDKKISVDATRALEGQIAGVSTYNDKIVIRGISTLSSDVGTNPLVVVDGMPTERSLNSINMNDVESITVLKDAAATSIYGVRAANGVIVVVTKKGEIGKTKVNFRADWEWKPNPSLDAYNLAPTDVYLDWEQRYLKYNAETVNGKSIYQFLADKRTGINASGNYFSPLYNLNYALGNGDITDTQFKEALAQMKNNSYYQEYMDLMWRTAFRQSYSLNLSNANDRQNTYVSFTYSGNNLQMKTSDNRTISGYISTDQRLTKWLSLVLNVDVRYDNSSSSLASGFNLSDFMGTTTGVEPYNRILDENGNRVQLPYTGRLAFNPQIINDVNAISAYNSYNLNVLDEIGKYDINNNTLQLRNIIELKFNIIKGLTFSSKFAYEVSRTSGETVWLEDSYLMRERRNLFISSPSAGVYTKNIPNGGRIAQSTGSSNNYTFRNQINYNNTFAEKHAVQVSAGIEIRENESPMGTNTLYYGYNPTTLAVATLDNYRLSASGTGNGVVSYLTNSTIRATELNTTKAGNYILHRYVAMYAAGSYTYDKRYGISGSFRIEQADLFGTDPKYRYRPLWSAGLIWNASNEQFMANTKNWLDFVSLKMNYGLMGNVDQSSSPYVLALSGTSQTYGDPINYTRLAPTAPNPTLRWERTASYGLEADFSIYKGLLSGTIGGYYKYSDDLLVNKPIPNALGYTTAKVNNGAMSNKGFELNLNSTWLKKSGWTLTSRLIASYNKNNIEKAFNQPLNANNYMTDGYYTEGFPRNSLYAYHFAGLYKDGNDLQNGSPQYTLRDGTQLVTVDAAGKITYVNTSTVKPEEAIYLGSKDPLWNGSFTQEIRYNNWELSAMFTFFTGHYRRQPIFDYSLASETGGIFRNGTSNLDKRIVDSWTPDNPTGTLPKTSPYYATGNGTAFAYIGDYWRYCDYNTSKADMIRLRNITLSYRLPEKYCKAVYMKSLRIVGQVNNLWFWSAAGKDYDPESAGIVSPPIYLLRLEIGL